LVKDDNTIFRKFVLDGIAALESARSVANNIKNKEMENIKIFLLAFSTEIFTKALLPLFGLLVLFPLFLFNKIEDLISKPNLMMDIGNLLRKIILTPFDEEELRRLGHKPISRSGLKELMYYVEKLLPPKIRRVYAKILDYAKLDPEKRTYEELKRIKEEIIKVFASLKFDDFLQGFIKEIYQIDPVTITNSINAFNIIFNDILEKILYMLYLEHAAGSVSRYSVGRSEFDEKYLSNVKDYQKEIFEFLDRERSILEKLSASSEFNDMLDEIRELFQKIYLRDLGTRK